MHIASFRKYLFVQIRGCNNQEKYETLKAQVDGAKAQADKEKAAREYFRSKGIKDERSLKYSMKAARPEIAELEIENGKIKDASSLDGLISDELSVFVSTTETTGTKTPNPAGIGGKAVTKESMVCCLLSNVCVATSFYQRPASRVYFFAISNLRNLLYLIPPGQRPRKVF